MKSSLSTLFTCTFFVLSMFAQANVQAQSTTVEQSSSPSETQSGGFLKLGAGYLNRKTPYGDQNVGYENFFSGRYQFENGLYGEFSHGGNEINTGTSIGYNFLNTNNWSFDLHLLRAHGNVYYTAIYEADGTNGLKDEVSKQNLSLTTIEDVNTASGEERIRVKLGETHMLGLRATGYFEDTLLQFIVAPYSFNDDFDDAFYASAWISESWQVRNWQFYSSVGATYRSSDIIDHYYNLNYRPDFEEKLPKLDSSLNITAQIGVSYSFAQSWLFESYYRYTKLSDSILDSPSIQLKDAIANSVDYDAEFALAISYVF